MSQGSLEPLGTAARLCLINVRPLEVCFFKGVVDMWARQFYFGRSLSFSESNDASSEKKQKMTTSASVEFHPCILWRKEMIMMIWLLLC